MNIIQTKKKHKNKNVKLKFCICFGNLFSFLAIVIFETHKSCTYISVLVKTVETREKKTFDLLIADNAMRTCESEQRLVQSSTEELKTYERNKKGSKRAKREEIKKENACMYIFFFF